MPSTLLNSIVSYWNLNEASGNFADSVGSNTGVATSCLYGSSYAKLGTGGAGFNGTTSKIIGSSITVPNTATINFWFKTSQSGVSYPRLFGFTQGTTDPGFGVSLSNNTIYGQLADSGDNEIDVNSLSNFNDGNWHMATITRYTVTNPGDSIQLYIDGVSQGTTTKSGGFSGNFNNYTLTMGIANQYYSGNIDECGYWSRALSSQEIQQLYNFGNGNSYSFLQEFNLLNMF